MSGGVGARASRRGAARIALVISVSVAALCAGLSAGVPSAAASGCSTHTAWTTFGFNDARTGANPCETALSRTTVPHLHLLWKANLSSVSVAQPTYAPGIVVNGVAKNLLFVADEHGYVRALDTATGQVVWSRYFGAHQSNCNDIPDEKYGVSGAPVLDVAIRTGWVAGGNDLVYAIDLATGANKPGWTPVPVGNPALDHVYGALTLISGTVYATTASYCDFGTYYGKVVAVSTSTGKVTTTWKVVNPATNPGQYGGGIWGPGGVSFDTTNRLVYTATGNGIPNEHAGYGEEVVRLDPTLHPQAGNYAGFVGNDVDYGATPLLFTPPGCPALLAAKNKSGVLVIYKRDSINAGAWQKIQMANQSNDQFNGIPAYGALTNMVYVSNSSQPDSLAYNHGMVAFKIVNCKLVKAWAQTFGNNDSSVSPPTIANGVVYEGDGPDDTVMAFNTQTGAKLWDSGSTIGGMVFAAPTVVDGRVYVAAWDNKVYAFGP